MFRDAIDNNCKFPNENNPPFGHSVLDRVNFWQPTEPTIVERLLGGCLHSESYLAALWSKVTQISLTLKLLTFWHLLEISLSSSFTAIWVTLDELRVCECARARLRCKLLANIQTMNLFLCETRMLDDLMAKKISNKKLDDFCSGVVKQSCAHAHSSRCVES